MRIGYLIFAVPPLLLCSCASSVRAPAGAGPVDAGRPAWIDGNAAGYPRSGFVTGVGMADDPVSAGDRARSEIAKVFSTKITLNTAVTSYEYSAEARGSTSSYSSQNAVQDLRAVSSRELEGVEIAETWRDGASGRYYALAVLGRAKALSALSGRLRETDERLREASRLLASAAEKLRKARYALMVLDILRERDALFADMRVLDPASVPAAEEGTYRRDAVKALAGLDVVLNMGRGGSRTVEAAVIKALGTLGMEARSAVSASGADISVECSVEFSAVPDTDASSRWKWSRGRAAIVLKDVGTGRVFLNSEVSSREASSTDEGARLKAESALGRKIGAEIRAGVASFLEKL